MGGEPPAPLLTPPVALLPPPPLLLPLPASGIELDDGAACEDEKRSSGVEFSYVASGVGLLAGAAEVAMEMTAEEAMTRGGA